jgi:hypothetical protein
LILQNGMQDYISARLQRGSVVVNGVERRERPRISASGWT